MREQDPLEIDILHKGGAYMVSLKGELDLDACPDLEAALLEAEQSDAAQILVDIRELTYIDSSGLGLFTRAAARARNNGERLRISFPQGQVASALRITQLDKQLPLEGQTRDLRRST